MLGDGTAMGDESPTASSVSELRRCSKIFPSLIQSSRMPLLATRRRVRTPAGTSSRDLTIASEVVEPRIPQARRPGRSADEQHGPWRAASSLMCETSLGCSTSARSSHVLSGAKRYTLTVRISERRATTGCPPATPSDISSRGLKVSGRFACASQPGGPRR